MLHVTYTSVFHESIERLKNMFQNEWSWKALEGKIAKFDHFLVHYENGGDALDLHYIHVKSPRSDAIPLILLHDWPSTLRILFSLPSR